jgi:hypothetical protein
VEALPVEGRMMYFAGTSTGLYSTANLEGYYTVWQQEGPIKIGNSVINMIDGRASDGFVAVGTHGVGMFSAFADNIPQPPAAPELQSPADNVRGILEETELEWRAVDGAGFYNLQIASDPEFSDIIFEEPGIRENTFTLNDLQQGHVEYFWRVRAKNSGGPGDYSPVWSFTTAVAPPELAYPENGAISVEIDTRLQWDDSPGAESYHIEVSSNLFFTGIVVDTVIAGQNYLDLQQLDYDKKYFWRVSSIDEDGEGISSATRNFRTKESLSVFGSSFDMNKTIKELYPNPASSFADVVISPEENGMAVLSLYDMQGRRLKTFFEQYAYAGNMNIRINLAGLPAGTYNLVLATENSTATRKLIIVE